MRIEKTRIRRTAASLFLLASAALPALAQSTPTTVTKWGVDDWNTVTLTPSPFITVYSCPWVDNGLKNAGFTSNNNWKFSYDTSGKAAAIAADLSVDKYYAWAVDSPDVTAPDGTVYNRNVKGEDAGGNVFQVSYKPKAGDPTNIHFVQAYHQSLNGGAYTDTLDNLGASTPWYDTKGASGIGTLANSGSWMLDIPFDRENEIEDYHTDVQFQAFIATDNLVNGVHNVTLYAGIWWGYQYSTSDVPTPGSLALLSSAGLLAVRRKHR